MIQSGFRFESIHTNMFIGSKANFATSRAITHLSFESADNQGEKNTIPEAIQWTQ
jgi:hypothetical protein